MTVEPVVSVLLMTHDHVGFVDEAIAGIEAQDPAFPVEVVLNDDCSTDGTAERLEEYAGRSRHRCRLVRSVHNLGPNPAVGRGIRACRGRYVALLDGDDRWVDPTKLTRQVAVLEGRPDLAVAFHDVAVIDADGRPTGQRWNGDDQLVETGLADLVYGCYAHTSSCMIRRSAIDPLPSTYDDFGARLTDWPLLVIAAHSGGLHYDPRIMSQYRIHGAGQYQGMARRAQVEATADAYHCLRPFVPPSLRPRLEEERTTFLTTAADEALADGRFGDAATHAGAVLLSALGHGRLRTAAGATRRLGVAALSATTRRS